MKKSLVLVIAIMLVMFTMGVTYAFFTYSRTSAGNNQIITGDIYLFFNEGSDTIGISNALPMSDTAGKAQTSNFQFTVTGKNQSDEDIDYDVMFIEGASQTGTRLSSEFIKVYMTKTENENTTTIIDSQTYSDWNYRRVYSSKIPANTNSEISHVYNLKIWISEDIWVSDTDAGADYNTTEFSQGYQSLKIAVDARTAE